MYMLNNFKTIWDILMELGSNDPYMHTNAFMFGFAPGVKVKYGDIVIAQLFFNGLTSNFEFLYNKDWHYIYITGIWFILLR